MRILLTGSGGLIGHALLTSLTADGHTVVRLIRPQAHASAPDITWDPDAGTVSPGELEGFDAVVHLAGESIMGRWTPAKKARILQSRIKGTQLLSESLAHLRSRPDVLVSASAIGYYGNRGEQVLNEESPGGSLFLSEVAKAWEASTESAKSSGIRVVNLRIGFVLSKTGGGLATMLLPFRLGLGGRVGNGRQYISWIAIDDLVGAISHAIGSDSLRGAVNAVAPNPVTNREFTKTLGRVLGRPTIVPLPGFAVSMAMGEMGNELLLAGARVSPARLLASGYEFSFPELEAALRHVLRKIT